MKGKTLKLPLGEGCQNCAEVVSLNWEEKPRDVFKMCATNEKVKVEAKMALRIRNKITVQLHFEMEQAELTMAMRNH